MYIKQVAIEGFKSYREQISIEEFSPKINCVVGANGSGKSNFFHAIQSVISDLFLNLPNEERQALLHDEAGHQVLSAFVEIVFDNSDNSIPVYREEVRLRRTIGVEKDEYFLDGKHIAKTEVLNLLVIAGFSRSNPYNVVQQGKVASLTLMKDSERLDLLKEIAGTRLYEEGCRESLKIMQETGNQRNKIIQVVKHLDGLLLRLDEEKEEMKKYEQQKKSLQYTIYDKEVHDAKRFLADIDEDLYRVSNELQTETELKKQELMDANSSVDQLTQELNSITQNICQRNRMEDVKVEKDKLKDEAKEVELLLRAKNIYVAKQELYSKKILELGPLSSEAFEEHKQKSYKELVELLTTCDERLKQFSHVNNEAVDEYFRLTCQREEMLERQAMLDASDVKIKELISSLCMRKEELIGRTFKGVAKHFRDVFSELVQGGHGFLVMMKKKDAHDDLDDDEPRLVETEGTVEKYIGVKVKVCFSGQGETQSMEQLSECQKTVVALALIFAIQRSDPAPIYLFDEIDAALDPHYRAAVGNMMRRVADTGSAQLIATTFREELVTVADKIYGVTVTQKNRVGHVNAVTKEDALHFNHNKNE